MKLYTSYWGQVRNFPTNLVGLSTCVWNPKWRPLGKDKRGIIVLDCFPLKPGVACDGLCNGSCNPRHPKDCKFLKAYSEQLNLIDIDKFFYSLQNLHDKICEGECLDDVDFAFIFFEKYDQPCSERWPFIKWMKDNKVNITEWSKNNG